MFPTSMSGIAAAALLSSFAVASPVNGSRLHPRSSYDGLKTFANNIDAMCKIEWGYSQDENINLWFGVGAQPSFNDWIAKYPDEIDQTTGEGWLTKMTGLVYDSDKELDNCAELDTTCGPIDDEKCHELVTCDAELEGCGAWMFWVLKSVTKWHDVMDDFYRQVILEPNVENALDIDAIVNIMGPADEEQSTAGNLWGILGGATSAASSALSGPVGALAGVASAAFSLSVQFGSNPLGDGSDPNEEVVTYLKQSASSYFDKFGEDLEQHMRDVTGMPGGDMRNLPAKSLTNTELSDKQIVQYFDQGKSLWSVTSSEDNGGLEQMAETMTRDTQTQMAAYSLCYGKRNMVMRWDRWHDEPMDKERCDQRHQDYGLAWWVDMGDYQVCAEFLAMGGGAGKDEHTNCRDGAKGVCEDEPSRLNDDQTNNLLNVYGFDHDRFYRNALACADSGGGSVAPEDWPETGELPPCFHNVWVPKGTWSLNPNKIGYWAGLNYGGYEPDYVK